MSQLFYAYLPLALALVGILTKRRLWMLYGSLFAMCFGFGLFAPGTMGYRVVVFMLGAFIAIMLRTLFKDFRYRMRYSQYRPDGSQTPSMNEIVELFKGYEKAGLYSGDRIPKQLLINALSVARIEPQQVFVLWDTSWFRSGEKFMMITDQGIHYSTKFSEGGERFVPFDVFLEAQEMYWDRDKLAIFMGFEGVYWRTSFDGIGKDKLISLLNQTRLLIKTDLMKFVDVHGGWDVEVNNEQLEFMQTYLLKEKIMNKEFSPESVRVRNLRDPEARWTPYLQVPAFAEFLDEKEYFNSVGKEIGDMLYRKCADYKFGKNAYHGKQIPKEVIYTCSQWMGVNYDAWIMVLNTDPHNDYVYGMVIGSKAIYWRNASAPTRRNHLLLKDLVNVEILAKGQNLIEIGMGNYFDMGTTDGRDDLIELLREIQDLLRLHDKQLSNSPQKASSQIAATAAKETAPPTQQAPVQPVSPAPSDAGRLNLNIASEADIAMLPGIGTVHARKAVQLRGERGGFRNIEEFAAELRLRAEVVEQLRELVTF